MATGTKQPQKSQATELVPMEAAQQVEALAGQLATKLADRSLGRIMRAVVVGQALDQLRRTIAPLMPMILSLRDTQIGFKTDRIGKEPYSDATVRDCVCIGLLRGVYPVDNEMNIIAGSLYIAQEGYRRKMLREIDGLTDLECVPGVPVVHNGRQVVRMTVKCKLDGQPWELKNEKGEGGRVYAVIAHDSTSVDAIVGKAKRKAYKDAYEQITGTEQTEDDAGIGSMDAPQPKTETLADRIRARSGTPTNGPAEPRASAEQLAVIEKLIQKLGVEPEGVNSILRRFEVAALAKLTPDKATDLISMLEAELQDAENQTVETT